MDQGYYYTTKRLEEEGYSEQEIKRKADSIQQADYKLFTDFNDCTIKESEIEKDRFLFIARNLKADSSVDLQNMQGPLLALWGSDDLNVPAGTNAQLYQQYTSNRESDTTTIKVYPRSTHGLLNAKLFNYQLDAQWPEWKKWLFVFQGRKAYSKDALFDISTFILKTDKKTE